MASTSSLFPFREFAIWYNNGYVSPACYLAWLGCTLLSQVILMRSPTSIPFEVWPLDQQDPVARLANTIRATCRQHLLDGTSTNDFPGCTEDTFREIHRVAFEQTTNPMQRWLLLAARLLNQLREAEDTQNLLAACDICLDEVLEKITEFEQEVAGSSFIWQQYHRPEPDLWETDTEEPFWVVGRGLPSSLTAYIPRLPFGRQSQLEMSLKKSLAAGPVRVVPGQGPTAKIARDLTTRGFTCYPSQMPTELLTHVWKGGRLATLSSTIGKLDVRCRWRDVRTKHTSERSLYFLWPGAGSENPQSLTISHLLLHSRAMLWLDIDLQPLDDDHFARAREVIQDLEPTDWPELNL